MLLVVVVIDVFVDYVVVFYYQCGGYYVVDEVMVVVDQQQCIGVFVQQFFQQFQGFYVQVVGWFVYYQQVGWLCEQFGQQQVVVFVIGQVGDWCMCVFWGEYEVLQVGMYVFVFVVEFEEIVVFGYVFDCVLVFVQYCVVLVEIGDLQVGVGVDFVFGWLQFFQQQFQQCCFVVVVGVDQVDVVVVYDGGGEVVDYGVFIEGE